MIPCLGGRQPGQISLLWKGSWDFMTVWRFPPQASSYDLADAADTPVILVMNVRGMSLSAASFLKGFLEYQKDSHIRGVILNQTSSSIC